jgi:acyl transferase domain-containing protein
MQQSFLKTKSCLKNNAKNARLNCLTPNPRFDLENSWSIFPTTVGYPA